MKNFLSPRHGYCQSLTPTEFFRGFFSVFPCCQLYQPRPENYKMLYFYVYSMYISVQLFVQNNPLVFMYQLHKIFLKLICPKKFCSRMAGKWYLIGRNFREFLISRIENRDIFAVLVFAIFYTGYYFAGFIFANSKEKVASRVLISCFQIISGVLYEIYFQDFKFTVFIFAIF